MTNKILIVDDVKENVELIKAFLEDEGYETISTNNGEDALKLIENEDIDLVLLDILMPGMDGIECCRKIKFDMQRDELPVVMVTALDAREDRLKGLEAGADDFITKPIDWAELIVRVKSLVRLKNAHDRVERQVDKLEYQLDMARKVQQKLVKSEFPSGLDGELFYRPVDKIGGDLYDFIKLDENRFAYLLSDSMGHGVPAALVMVMLKHIFNSIEHKNLSTAELLSEVNERLIDNFGHQLQDFFVTAVYLIIDKKNKLIHWSNAGHPYPLLINKQNEWIGLETTAPPLGIKSALDFDEKVIEYKDESKIFSYTDGLADFLAPEENSLPPEVIEDIVPEFAVGRSGKSEFYEWLINKIDNNSHFDDICYTLINL